MESLSKTSYMMFQKCPKLFWTHVNQPWLIPQDDESPFLPHIQEGREIERYAQRLFPNGLQIDRSGSLYQTIALSHEAVHQAKEGHSKAAIFNPIIVAPRVMAELDILKPVGKKIFDLYEVKSATKSKDYYLEELNFIVHVCLRVHVEIRNVYLLHIENAYVRSGEIEPKKLFKKLKANEEIATGLLAGVVSHACQIAAQKECPTVNLGVGCNLPFPCPMISVCWKRILEDPCHIFTLNRLRSDKAMDLMEMNVVRNADIPPDFKLTPRQRIQIEAERTGKPHVNGKELKAFLGRLKYPLHYLDFETIAPAVPLLDGTSPYEAVPFQFSLHVQAAPDATPVHHGWIWDGKGQEPHRVMLERLQGLIGKRGSVVAYNAAFEKGVLKRAARMWTPYQDWVEGLIPRFVDLWEPFRNYVLYSHLQHGSGSIKQVLPAWTGRGYEGLEIANGGTASAEFLRVLGSGNEGERQRVLGALEAYCCQDTMGMAALVRVLLN